jgi:hypothetical protein
MRNERDADPCFHYFQERRDRLGFHKRYNVATLDVAN